MSEIFRKLSGKLTSMFSTYLCRKMAKNADYEILFNVFMDNVMKLLLKRIKLLIIL